MLAGLKTGRYTVPGTMDTQFQNALLIHNPNAGSAGNARRRLIDEARHSCRKNGIQAEAGGNDRAGSRNGNCAEGDARRAELVIASA